MKLPLSWLKDYVDIDCSIEDLEKKLFSCGFEVEEVIKFGENIDKIVTCKILSMEKHPNADKLTVTKVDAGKYGVLQIITAATNLFVGAIVPVALDGSTLFNGEHIYNGELRGLPSYGMFCSGIELGINDDFYKGASINGILILKEDYPLGEEVKKLLEIEDVIFDINVTANRPDCQSILGLAREVSAVLNKPLKMPDLTFKRDDKLSTLNTVKVTNEAYDLCPRYMSQLVSDIKIEESPSWIKKRLFSMGLRSINNIVDITNFVLLEIGQPMHAFDLNDLEENKIIVRRANDGEKIITLDEKEFTLNQDNLVIADGNKPSCLAGVMGGLNSGIKDSTKNVVFESARFRRDNIRKTSRALGQRSDSSSRYEKGVDFWSVETGLKRALNLIDKLNCGKIAVDFYDLHQEKIQEKTITTTLNKVNAVLGITVPKETVKEILERLTFKVNINGESLSIVCPLYREDMESYPDIAEEIIREYGYSHITPTLLKTSSITNGGLNYEQKKVKDLKNLLVGYGFNEMISYSFVSEKEYDLFGLDKSNTIKIMNPIGEDMAVMRTSLLPSVLRAVSYNLNRKNFDGRLFELAKVYIPKDKSVDDLPVENQVLSFAVFGDNEDFFSLKGVIEGILSNFCCEKEVSYEKCDYSFMHPTRSAIVKICGKIVGYFGQINPVLGEKIEIDKPTYAGEIYYDVLKEYFNDKIIFKPISKFPIVERDLAIILDENISWGDVVSTVKESSGEFLSALKLFDIYRADALGKGKKSMAFNLVFVSQERTLTVEEIDDIIKRVLKSLKEKLNADLR